VKFPPFDIIYNIKANKIKRKYKFEVHSKVIFVGMSLYQLENIYYNYNNR